MKHAPVLLLALFSFAAHAQPIYRCVSSSGTVAYQDRACSEGTEAPAPQAASVQVGYADVGYSDTTGYTQGGWTNQQRRQRQREAKVEWRAEAVRVRALLEHVTARRNAEYAENHRRCETALQIASLCGSTARRFSCDKKGFRAESLVDESPPALPGTFNNGAAFKMQQCALQLSKGRN